MKKLSLLVLFFFSITLQAFAGKGSEFKYAALDIDAESGQRNVETVIYTFEGLDSDGIAFCADANGCRIKLKITARCKDSYKLDGGFRVKIVFGDGKSYTLKYAGIAIEPQRISDYSEGYATYLYLPEFYVSRDIIKQFATTQLTSIKSLDLNIRDPFGLFTSKAGIRRAENIRQAAEHFLSYVPEEPAAAKGSDVTAPTAPQIHVGYKTDKVDDFTGERVIETEPVAISQKASIGFSVVDKKFYIVMEISKDGKYNTEISRATKTTLIFDELSANTLETTNLVEETIGNSTRYTIKAECTRQLIEKVAKKRLVKVRTNPDGEIYTVVTKNMEQNIKACATDFIVKAKPLPGEEKGKDLASITYPDYHLQGDYSIFERNEETGMWLVDSRDVLVGNDLGLAYQYSKKRYANGNTYYILFTIIDNGYFTSPHDKDMMLKLEDGTLIKLTTIEFKMASQPYYGAPKYTATNYAESNRADIEKLAKSPISKIRIVINKSNGRENVDENFERTFPAEAAAQLQQIAKEMVAAIPADM